MLADSVLVVTVDGAAQLVLELTELFVVTPFVLDPRQPARILMGTYRPWESTDGGASWHFFSPGAYGQNLSPKDAGTDRPGGGTITTLSIALAEQLPAELSVKAPWASSSSVATY